MTGEVSPAEPARQPVSLGELRASHEDRDKVVELLRVAAGDGRLTAEELDERLERALQARTYNELAVLTADLPAAGGGAAVAPQPDPSVQPRELVRIQTRSGHIQRDGAWVVPQAIDLSVTSGHVKLDFTSAVITSRTLRIEADVHSGHLMLVTRPGVVVDADEVAVRSGHVKTPTPWRAGVPEILRIEITGQVRSGHINARPPRRSFWQWLRRAPRPYADALR
ncbi:MAG TPA: DUF1707 domain-containing protein [Streptosporangiaceae bacterium]|nr:DUF1707 domain-containing protein [Streptosporangiaceae bacterium]